MKLKPVTLVSTKYTKRNKRPNHQSILLNTLTISKDPEKMQQIMNVQKVAGAIKTLDKIVLRKQYHEALHQDEVDFKFIVKGIKKECEQGDKSSDRLKGYQILLRSLGMDSYDDSKDESTANWEDALQKVIKEKKLQKAISAPEEVIDQEYEVIQPKVPDSVKSKKQEESVDAGKSLYE
jgi:hypothetical protein